MAVSLLLVIAVSLRRIRRFEGSGRNRDLFLKPGTTATSRLVVNQHDNVLRKTDQALRVTLGGRFATSSRDSGLHSRVAEESAARMRARSIELWLLILFFLISHAIWLEQFSIQRYVLPLELLAGVLILLGFHRIMSTLRTVAVAFGYVVLFAGLWTRPPDWSRLPYSQGWFDVAPPKSSPSASLYVMLSMEPMSYAIPFMSRDDRFVRLDGNMPLEPEMPLGRRAAEIIRQYPGPIRTLTVGPLDEDAQARLRRFGLRWRPSVGRFSLASTRS